MVMVDVIVAVHNGEGTIVPVLDRLLALSVPSGWQISFVVVDDGSTDATADLLRRFYDVRLKIVETGERTGRAAARNRGAECASGDYLLMIDADCLPAADDFLQRLVGHLAEGADIVYGPIEGTGAGFWPRYLKRVARDRLSQAKAGDHLAAMTTGILLVRRALFDKAGGFSGSYRHYGFEDKDLIARLLTLRPEVVFDEKCVVVHDAHGTVASYCGKMHEAGRWSAPLFSQRHPIAYAAMSYSRLDPDFAMPPLAFLLRRAALSFSGPAVRFATWMVARSDVPWVMQLIVVRVAAALSYARGCAERTPQ